MRAAVVVVVVVVFIVMCFGQVPSASPAAYEFNSNSNPAEQMLLVLLDFLIKESSNATQTCVLQRVGPGIGSSPSAARAFFALSQAMYNSWSRFHPWANSTVYADDLQRYNSPTSNTTASEAVVRSAYLILEYLLPERVTISNLASQINTGYGIDVTTTSSLSGQSPASTVAWTLTNRLITNLNNDNSNQQNCYSDRTNFFPINNPSYLDSELNATLSRSNLRSELSWSQIIKPPFINSPAPFLDPNAALLPPFAVDINSIYPPPLLNFSTLQPQFQSLIQLQSNLESNDSIQKLIVEYWIDAGSPYWVQAAIRDVSQPKNYTLSQTVRILLLTSASIYDAGIIVWSAKRIYQSVRPSTFITTLLFSNTSTILSNQYQGPYCPHADIPAWNWIPYQPLRTNSPAHPEYPSAHSAFSNAAATALANFTKSEYYPAGPKEIVFEAGSSSLSPQCFRNGTNLKGMRCVYQRCGVDENWDSENGYLPKGEVVLGPFERFSDAAEQAGRSRLLGGIHVEVSNEEGLELGRRVSEAVFGKVCGMMPCGESDELERFGGGSGGSASPSSSRNVGTGNGGGRLFEHSFMSKLFF
eukprot:TRINITY_DN3808_c0_g2_i1.p1 TRINITY_DN3808_c0_g2~~TRINITY_DN3808_c0_g2_i1.p1  ORF type:complete len:636 (-),score=176.86 TRINITY_DN3808_c0_g2_i1:50-1807(-)